MNDLSKVIAGLSPDKLGALHERLNRKRVPATRVSIPAQPRTSNTFPLSFGQQRYWFLSRLDPESAAYNVPTAVRLKGKLDVAALERSINEVVRRHESLRTNFNLVDDQLVQIIAPELLLSLPITSLDHLPENERAAEVERLGLVEAQAPFDLTRDALLRAKLLRVETDEHVLLITTHHIVCDKWSHGVFMQELASIYAATVLGQPAVLPTPSVQPADVACWQRDWLQGPVLEEQLAYWTMRLGDLASGLNLPTDHPRTAPQVFRAGRIPFVIGRESLSALKTFGQRHDVTLFMTLMAAFKALLQRITEQDKIAVSFLSANRNRSEIVNVIGQFANTLLLNTDVTPEQTFQTLLATIRETTLGAYAHQDFPFERLVEELQPAREAGRVPLFQVAFNLQKAPPVNLRLPELILTPFEIYRGPAGLDLYLEMEERDDELAGAWEYNAELFDATTAQSLLNEYTRLIEFFVAGADQKLSEFELQPELGRRLATNRARDRKQTIAVAATFTAEPLEDVLSFWMDLLEFPSEIRFASYNQVFQELLDPSSLLSTNHDGVNVVLIRFEDWQRFASVPEKLLSADVLERGVRELADALQTAAARAVAPILVFVCPASTEIESAGENRALLARMETLLETELAEVRGVYSVSSVELKSAYEIAQRDDRHADSIGHIPYNEKFFAALGTVVARKIRALRHSPYKVIVLDCDQTLWRGVCAEDGALGVVIDDGCRDLQEFMLTQYRAGMLLCLCSKNEEADVFEVFAKHPGMILKREHIVAARINWEPKSNNLRALAAELNLDLGSFVFIDDDPVICAEVEANCPEVLTINDATALRRIWAFDRLKVTAEDRQRTDFYQKTVERERLRRSQTTFADFLAGLELEVEVFPLAATYFARVAQLLERTTQFNTTGLRRTEAELEHAEGFVVKVRDRFGDYGTVGAAIFRSVADALVVESFILSCRALGRGVEHRMVGELGALAERRGLQRVDVSFVRTNRNRPAEEFLTQYGQQYRTETQQGTVFRFPTDAAARLVELPIVERQSPTGVLKSASESGTRHLGIGNVLRRVNAEFSGLDQILQGIEQHKRRTRKTEQQAFVAPRTPVEEIVAEIWARMLGVEKVGVHSNFFQLGGHSVLATMLVAKISETFAMDLTLRAFFERPTVAAIAEVIELYQIEHSDASMLSELDGLSDEEVKALLASETQLMREQLSEA